MTNTKSETQIHLWVWWMCRIQMHSLSQRWELHHRYVHRVLPYKFDHLQLQIVKYCLYWHRVWKCCKHFKCWTQTPMHNYILCSCNVKATWTTSATFKWPECGQNWSEILSQVFRPIIKVFFLEGADVEDVISLKNFTSEGSFHGSFPSLPIPISLVVATKIWKVLLGSGGVLENPSGKLELNTGGVDILQWPWLLLECFPT